MHSAGIAWRWVDEVDVAPLIAALGQLVWLPGGSGREHEFAMLDKWPSTFPVEPIFERMMAHYPGRYRGNTLISKMVPGQRIEDHRDHHEGGCRIRIHVPLTTNLDAIFTIAGESFHMDVGHAYEIDPNEVHSVFNGGDTDRIHLIFNAVE